MMSGRKAPTFVRAYRAVALTVVVALAVVPALVLGAHAPAGVVAPVATFLGFFVVVAWAFDYGVYGGLFAPLGIFLYYVLFASLTGIWLITVPDAFGMLAVEIVAGVAIGRLRVLGRGLRRGERRFRALTSDLSDIVLVIDRHGAATYASESFRKLLGYDPAELLGFGYRRMLGHKDETLLRDSLTRAMTAGGESERFELALLAGEATAHVFDVCATNYLADRAVGGVVFSGRDISSRKRAEALLRTQALHDALTGLPNRSHFLACLEQEIGQIQTTRSVAVMFVDLNGFKEINDTFGHEAGDEFLREIARRVNECVGTLGIAARLGGDEFAVLLPGQTSKDATFVARRIVSALGKPMEIAGEERQVGASIGIAATAQPVDSTTLLRRADGLMYAAKRSRTGIVSDDAIHPDRTAEGASFDCGASRLRSG
jgi:diguanylate cyclase (GGDEF)-like protein/PAS domain S-box-containing protein